MASPKRLATDEYGIIVGPATLLKATASWDVDDVAEHAQARVRTTILAFPGMREINDGSGLAIWESSSGSIRCKSIEELPNGDFGLLHLRCDCSTDELLKLLEWLQAAHQGLWLYNKNDGLLVTKQELLIRERSNGSTP